MQHMAEQVCLACRFASADTKQIPSLFLLSSSLPLHFVAVRGMEMDIAVDPLDGTTLTAQGRNGAVSVSARRTQQMQPSPHPSSNSVGSSWLAYNA